MTTSEHLQKKGSSNLGSTEDCEWFENEFNKVLKKDGPCGVGENQTIMYLKRDLEFRNNEFYSKTNRKYLPKLADDGSSS